VSDNVIPLNGIAGPSPAARQIAESVANTVRMFEDVGDAPTGAVWVIFDDEGAYRVGWDSNNSKLPATALNGLAIRALLDGPPRCSCGGG
jgi:hypothetical protein